MKSSLEQTYACNINFLIDPTISNEIYLCANLADKF